MSIFLYNESARFSLFSLNMATISSDEGKVIITIDANFVDHKSLVALLTYLPLFC